MQLRLLADAYEVDDRLLTAHSWVKYARALVTDSRHAFACDEQRAYIHEAVLLSLRPSLSSRLRPQHWLLTQRYYETSSHTIARQELVVSSDVPHNRDANCSSTSQAATALPSRLCYSAEASPLSTPCWAPGLMCSFRVVLPAAAGSVPARAAERGEGPAADQGRRRGRPPAHARACVRASGLGVWLDHDTGILSASRLRLAPTPCLAGRRCCVEGSLVQVV